MYRGCELKAFCLAFAFVLVALPAGADELPQTSNAWRAIEPDLADPGKYKWTVIDNSAGGDQAPAAVMGQDAPAKAALAQIRAETARVMEQARLASAKVERIRYDLRVSCVVEQVTSVPDPLDNVAMPWLWDSIDDEDRAVLGTVEMCEVDYTQQVRSQAQPQGEAQVRSQPQPQMRDYKISFPID
jgi:hypothetical protein